MKCSKGHKMAVVDTVSDGKRTYRRHKCLECGEKAYSLEYLAENRSTIYAIKDALSTKGRRNGR